MLAARIIYILPEWKDISDHGGLHFALKQWDPDLPDGINFVIYPPNGIDSYQLQIGGENNEKVELNYVTESSVILLKSKTLPDLISIGKWSDFWLQITQGKIRFGYEELTTALFEWTHDNPEMAFKPRYLTFMSLNKNTIGVSFPNWEECFIEVTTIRPVTRVMPMGWGRGEELLYYNNLTIFLRGEGTIRISLIQYPEDTQYYMLYLGEYFDKKEHFLILASSFSTPAGIMRLIPAKGKLFTTNQWTKFQILFKEQFIDVVRNNETILKYQLMGRRYKHPFIFYWFSVGAEPGNITWAANCIPADIDAAPIDGGWTQWSPWECSVTCGGGTG